MEVRVIKRINYLPKVFMVSGIVKYSITDNFINCARYSSRSGKTQQGCGILTNEFRETRGIYYVPVDSYAHISFRRKEISDENDVQKLLKDFPMPFNTSLLISWDNYSVYVYDRYVKGRYYEFPIKAYQGHLSIFNTPPVKEAYKISVEDQQEKMELDKSKFEEINEFNIYNHTVKFEHNVLKYTNLHMFGGIGTLIYVSETSFVELQSPDHGNVKFLASSGEWLLFSHPYPQKDTKD